MVNDNEDFNVETLLYTIGLYKKREPLYEFNNIPHNIKYKIENCIKKLNNIAFIVSEMSNNQAQSIIIVKIKLSFCFTINRLLYELNLYPQSDIGVAAFLFDIERMMPNQHIELDSLSFKEYLKIVHSRLIEDKVLSNSISFSAFLEFYYIEQINESICIYDTDNSLIKIYTKAELHFA